MADPHTATVSVSGRTLRVTNLDKVLYPATGTTKADVMGYYAAVAEPLLRQLAGRPVTRKRWPNGVDGPVFFEKNAPGGRPEWIETVTLHHSGRGREAHDVAYVLAGDDATLVWFAQVAALELHTPQWRVDSAGERLSPDRLVIDLDPGPPAGLAECAEVALAARELLADHGLVASAVLSGSKGIHLYADLPGAADLPEAAEPVDPAELAHALADELARRFPRLAITTMQRDARRGKVFVDWSQNNQAKTTVTPYSLRGREHPTAATPVTWAEVVAPGLRQFEYPEVLQRLATLGDLLHLP